MNRILPLFLILCACGTRPGPPPEDGRFTIGIADSVYSRILGAQRKVWVYVPHGFNNSMYGAGRFPVVYLLDGESHFHSFTGLVDQLSTQNGQTTCPEMIVVGIPNIERTHDLTPTVLAGVPNSGGGEQFLAFLEKELMPHIDSVYHPAPYRMLVGHSYGGLLAIYSLLYHPALFQSYIAIDPSLGWDDRFVIRHADSLMRRNRYRQQSLFLAVAHSSGSAGDLATVRKDTTDDTYHTRSILAFYDQLKRADTGLNWDAKYYEEEDHGSVPMMAEYEALHALFQGYSFEDYGSLYDSAVSADSARGVVLAHFRAFSRKLGYDALPPEQLINTLAYQFLGDGLPGKALAFFRWNMELYPRSGNVYDSMGDYYVAEEDRDSAVKYFTKALSLGGKAGYQEKAWGAAGPSPVVPIDKIR